MQEGDRIELNICLGEERFGIDIQNFEGLCRYRSAKYAVQNEPRYPGYRHRVTCYNRNWSFPTHAIRVIGKRNESR